MEKIETEKYDYRKEEKRTDRLLMEVEELNNEQRIEACQAIQRIKTGSEEKRIREHSVWFDKTVLPLLKDWAVNSFSELSIEREECGVITVTLRNSYGLDVQDSDCRLRMILLMAAQLLIDVEDEEVLLTLTYDCRR